MGVMDVLRVELTEDEIDVTSAIALRFSNHNGNVHIVEEWGGFDEAYGDGYTIKIPSRVWAIALPWLIARTSSAQIKRDQTASAENETGAKE